MAEAVVHLVLGKITESAYKEALLLYGAKDKVEWATEQLEWVSTFLEDADAKQNKNARVKRWVKDVKEVAYMIEDALDKFLVEMDIGGRPSKGVLEKVRHMLRVLVARHKMGTEIDKIRERMQQIRVNVDFYSLVSSSRGEYFCSSRQPVRPILIPEIDKTEIVGFKDDINNICDQLLDKNVSRRSVISIVGAGGRGKTTLAANIYKSGGIESHFDCRIWVTISQEYETIEVLKKMLKKLEGENATPQGDIEDFITKVHNSLRKKMYLIVLDDVWPSENHDCSLWSRLEVALPEDHNGSRVLITTRFISVAKESDAVNKPYELRTLNEDDSLQLLMKKAFPNQFADKCPHNLLPLTKLFAKNCGGWPLALVVLGGILSTKYPDYNTWNELMLKMDWQIEGSKCLDIISTSYEILPFYLKPCFMYVALFPEDYKIKATTLIQFWIAEGFIRHESTKTMEDTAQNYLEELVQRCMIQVSERSWSGKIKYVCVHDILHELAIRKAEEDNFLLVCSKRTVYSASGPSSSTRRLAYSASGFPEGLFTPNLRSLFCFGGYPPNYNELRMIRILHVEYHGPLYEIRYSEDPKRLKHLNTLRYFRCNGRFEDELPVSFWNNKMLRYVKMDGTVMGPPSSVKLENLVTLKGVVARGEWTVKMPDFPFIRKLGVVIIPDIDWEELTNSMSKLEHIESLFVAAHWNDQLSHPCVTPAFKSYKRMHSLYLNCNWPGNAIGDSGLFPSHLVKLTIENCRLTQDPMPELQKLRNLRVLRLLEESYSGERLIFSAGGFRCLEQLKLFLLRDLKELQVEESAMPVLHLLEISHCYNLEILPNLQCLTNLRELIVRMSDNFILRLKGADQHKIKHIPSILFEVDT